jgi:hypothetical protein
MPFAVLFHPNHWLYSVFGYCVDAAALACRLHLRAITVLQVWNSLVGALIVYRIYGWIEQETNSRNMAVFATLLFACGATWWKFATDADPYMISIDMFLLAVLFASAKKPRLIAAGACHLASMLFHELGVFAYVPILVAIGTAPQPRSRFVKVAVYIAATVAVVFAAYYACYRAGGASTHTSLLAWVTSYAGNTPLTRSPMQIATQYAASYSKLFFGGKLTFLLHSWLSAVSVAMCLGALIWFAYALKYSARDTVAADRRTRLILWAWFLPAAVFLAWFDPGNSAHKLFLWPCLVLLIATMRWPQQHSHAFGSLVIALAAWNFGAFIYPHSRPENDAVLMMALRLEKQLPKNATIYYAAFNTDDAFLDYFAPGRSWRPLNEFANTPEAGTTCFETTALEHGIGNVPLDPTLRWDMDNPQHRIHVACTRGNQ